MSTLLVCDKIHFDIWHQVSHNKTSVGVFVSEERLLIFFLMHKQYENPGKHGYQVSDYLKVNIQDFLQVFQSSGIGKMGG